MAISIAVVAAASAKKMPAPSPEDAVRTTLENYRVAIVGKDGATAVGLVDKGTLAYYGTIATAALTADKATLAKRSLIDRITVLRLRAELPAKKLRGMSGKDVFQYIVDEGWNERLSRGKAEIKAVKVDGKVATADVLAGRMGAMTWKLSREGDAWRVDVRSMLPAAEKMLAAFQKRSGQPEDQFVLTALKFVTGKAAPATLWDPLLK